MAYTRPLDDIRVGGEIDSMCTRCRMLTNHRIVAMVDGTVKRVICLTCDSQHNFRPAPGEKTPKAAKVRRVSKEMKKTSTSSGGRVFAQWFENKKSLEESGAPTKPYAISENFNEGEAIIHSKFGLGFIQKTIPPNKVEIMFENEIKTLAMNMAL